MLNIEQIAAVCYYSLKSLSFQLGENWDMEWDQVPSWKRISTIKSVEYIINHPLLRPEEEYTCGNDYYKLPIEVQLKDRLFKNVVLSLI